MNNKDKRPETVAPLVFSGQVLRRRAEDIAREKAAQSPQNLKAMSSDQIQQTLHELLVHQIQLEMQNEELRRAQSELDAARERYFDLYDLAPVGYCTLSQQGLILETNLTAATLLGRERRVLAKQPISRFILQEDQDIYYLHRQQLFSTGEPQDYELRMVKMDGTAFWARLAATVAQDANGAHVCRFVLSDITDRKQMEETLRLSEECFSKAFNNSPVLMAITSLNEGRIINVNNAFCRILDYSHEELIGRTALDIGFWADLADRCRVQQSLMGKQSVQEMEIGFCKKTGEQRQGLYSAEGLEINGESCILSLLTDITELRQMEIEMTRLDRLNLVGEIAASIGHEIRNPMTTVRGYLQILRANKDYLAEIERFDLMIEELDGANSIITEFLSLAKNKMVDMTPQNLNLIISNSLPLIQPKAMSQNQYIKLEMHDLPDLLIDKKEIRQLILNLVNNGLESMSSAGDVTIRTFVEKQEVVLAVQDKGHGIESKLLEKMGTPFFTTKEQGTGLGLAVCYRIADRHNAKIGIDTSSSGTTFYVRFPIPIAATVVS
jgi:PAS domain S-box-containing protein